MAIQKQARHRRGAGQLLTCAQRIRASIPMSIILAKITEIMNKRNAPETAAVDVHTRIYIIKTYMQINNAHRCTYKQMNIHSYIVALHTKYSIPFHHITSHHPTLHVGHGQPHIPGWPPASKSREVTMLKRKGDVAVE